MCYIRVGFLSGYPIPRKNPDHGDKNSRDISKVENPEKILYPGDFA